MAFKLLRAGTITQEELEDTGIFVTYRVPDRQAAKEITRQLDLWSKNMDRYIDLLAVVIGLVVEKLEGIELDDQKEYVLEKNGTGALTEESLSIILPVGQKLLNFVLEKINLDFKDRKNS